MVFLLASIVNQWLTLSAVSFEFGRQQERVMRLATLLHVELHVGMPLLEPSEQAVELRKVGARLAAAVGALERATDWMLQNPGGAALAAATPYLQLAGDVIGGWVLARQAILAAGSADPWLRSKVAPIVGMAVYFRDIQNINLGGRISKGEFQYTLQSSDTELLYKTSEEMRAKIATLPFLRDVNSDLYIKNPQVTIDIDREKAAFFGISVDQIRQELYNAFGSRRPGLAGTTSAAGSVGVSASRSPKRCSPRTATTALAMLAEASPSSLSDAAKPLTSAVVTASGAATPCAVR